MRLGRGMPRAGASRRHGAYRPSGETLEQRVVLANSYDLANIAGTTAAGPYGVELLGSGPRGGAGFSVAVVGDMNGDGFDDFIVSAPTVQQTTIAGALGYITGNGSGSTAYLVFGSQQVNLSNNPDFSRLIPQQRVGSLGNLGNATQTNPLNPNGGPGFAFNGLILSANQSTTSFLGTSVAALGDINGDGFADAIIGAPGANDATGNNAGTGRAYILFGGANLSSLTTKTVDLDAPLPNTLNVLTFTNVVNGGNNAANSLTGYSVSQAGNLFGAGSSGVAIGAPNASMNGINNSGAIYVVPSTLIRALVPPGSSGVSAVVDLSRVGQSGANALPGVVLTGSVAGGVAGFSMAPAGNTTGASGGLNQGVGDFIIGAPGFNPFFRTTPTVTGAGAAYLVIGSPNLAGQATVSTTGFRSIPLGTLGTGGIVGAIFQGEVPGDLTGYSVSSAGDFNGDNLADVLIGAPGFATGSGRVSLIEGNAALTSAANTASPYALSSLPGGVNFVNYVGPTTGSLAGYSVSATLPIPASTLNNVLIGAPGANSSAGQVYVIPGNTTAFGTVDLSNPNATSLQATVLTNTALPSGSFLGSSVSGRLIQSPRGLTVDADGIGDFLIGAAGASLGSAPVNAGAAFVVQGRFIALTVPAASGVSPPITAVVVGTTVVITVSPIAPFPGNPGFDPTTIDPATITINGVAFPGATLVANPNGTATITVSPLSALGLPSGVNTINVAGVTLATGTPPSTRFASTTTLTIAGGNNGGGGANLPGAVTVSNSFGFPVTNAAISNIGERLVPLVQTLSPLQYKPLPYARAFRQFLPSQAFRDRHEQIYNKNFKGRGPATTANSGKATLDPKVFTRNQFPRNKPIPTIHHKTRLTIPRTLY